MILLGSEMHHMKFFHIICFPDLTFFKIDQWDSLLDDIAIFLGTAGSLFLRGRNCHFLKFLQYLLIQSAQASRNKVFVINPLKSCHPSSGDFIPPPVWPYSHHVKV